MSSLGLKAQDVLVLLKASLWRDREWRQIDMALALGLSQSEVGNALRRLHANGLLAEAKKKPQKLAVAEFLVHAVKYMFPAQMGTVSRGMPTAHSGPVLSRKLNSNSNEYNRIVWPYEKGETRGVALRPIYSSVPEAAQKDEKLYELLTLVDSIRSGFGREQNIAVEEIQKRIQQA
jgi:hypothetical protein